MDNERECRICRSEDSELTLVRPCECKGSIGLIHLECLYEWIQNTNNKNWEKCEVCHTKYKISFQPKSFFKWGFPRFTKKEKIIISILVPMCIILLILDFAFVPRSIIKDITEIDGFFFFFLGTFFFLFVENGLYLKFYHLFKVSVLDFL
jgi:hypothetical protein